MDDELLASLRKFEDCDGGWGTPRVGELIDLDLIDYEESYDGTEFRLTGKGRDVLERGAL